MSKVSLAAQFDRIQAQLEAVGWTVAREGRHALRAGIVLHEFTHGLGHWTGAIVIVSQGHTQTSGRVDINYVPQWAKGKAPCDVFAALLSTPFGRTTIGAVFGL